ncbi:hypothetical protein SUVZ_04G2300 [Saccharomyces uvarum]|uniref:Mediator of RNA polymerase II transcription subunit 2 n=1 Tax=Saccharomyces uvarum TaxID=230603 RepID=A0ABN8WW79_SACUV|nr:hypothetical protein SUVZ_04G2300 [Saccharomyces uvarum]
MVVQNTPAPSVHIASSLEQGKSTKTTYKNKLTVCFDDILKVGAEMMMQQQLKNVQLGSYLANGFSQSQQKLLKEKVKLFHGILDDLETSLNQSSSYVKTLTALGKEREKEREEAEMRKAEEENLRKLKEQEELKKRHELEEASQQQQQQQNPKEPNGLGIDFSTAAPSSTAGTNDRRQNNQELGPPLPSNQIQIENTNNAATNGTNFSPVAATQSQGQQGQPSDAMFNDLNSMDISMFSGLDNAAFDSTAFNAPPDSTKGLGDNNLANTNNDINTPSVNTNMSTNTSGNSNKNNTVNTNTTTTTTNNNDNNDNNNSNDNNNTNNNGNSIGSNDLQTANIPNAGDNPPPADNGDEYLTLNDFNDLNIDWSTTGDNGELDLSGFSI